jgi:hypothetical protein
MADNTTLNTGTGGDVIATDDIAGVKYQRVKLVLGADGVNGGDVSSSNAMPVSDNGSSLTVDNAGTFAVQAAQSGNYTVRNQDGAGNNLASSTTTPAGTEQALIVRNIPSGTQTISGTVSGTGSFTVAQATAANLNATVTGTVAATQSGTWNITNISGTVSLPTGAATSANQTTQITALQLLDDVVATDGTAALTKLYQVGGTDGTNAQILSTNVSGHLNIADGGNSITVDGTVTANAGTGNFTVVQATAANLNATVTGTVAATQSGTWSSRTQDGSGNNVTSRTTGSARPFDVAIVDGSGNQVTTFGGGTQYADGAAQATPTGTVAMGTDGTNVYAIATDNGGNIGVNVQNTVNVSDAGGSITIDGSVTANQPSSTAYRVIVSDGTSDVPIDAAHSDAETNTENHIDVGAKGLFFNGSTWDRMRGSVADGLLVNLGTNNDITGTVTANAGTGTFVVGDGGSSLTVDGTVTVTDGLNIEGDVAHDTVDSGNPVKIGFQAETSFPTAVATGDRSNGISDVFGRQLVAHVDAGMQVWKGANYTTQQTGADIWTPSAGKKICITYLAVSSYATTTGRVILWMGASGDTTYTAGTDQLIWAGSFAPSANAKPGAIVSLPYGITAVTADHRLKITTDAAISLDITVYGYEC